MFIRDGGFPLPDWRFVYGCRESKSDWRRREQVAEIVGKALPKDLPFPIAFHIRHGILTYQKKVGL
jgi:hypothetical protein